MAESTKRAVLQKAVDALGEKQTAERLGCSPTHLKGWLAGAAQMPDQTFLKLIDLIAKRKY